MSEPAPILLSVLTCPECGYAEEMEMPTAQGPRVGHQVQATGEARMPRVTTTRTIPEAAGKT